MIKPTDPNTKNVKFQRKYKKSRKFTEIHTNIQKKPNR